MNEVKEDELQIESTALLKKTVSEVLALMPCVLISDAELTKYRETFNNLLSNFGYECVKIFLKSVGLECLLKSRGK